MMQKIAEQAGFFVGAFLAVFIVGATCGLLPLIAGLCRRKRALAGGSWATCVLVGLVGWIVTSTPEVSLCICLPLAFVLMLVILCRAPRSETCAVKESNSQEKSVSLAKAAQFVLVLMPLALVPVAIAVSIINKAGFSQEPEYGQWTPGTTGLDAYIVPIRELPDKTVGYWIETRRYKYQVCEPYQEQFTVALYRKRLLRSDEYIGWMGKGRKSYHEMSLDIPTHMNVNEAVEAIKVHQEAAGDTEVVRITDLGFTAKR